jgi:serine/threonine protein kinase
MVHADLKPANVLIDGDGTAKLCDFELRRIMQKEAKKSSLMLTKLAHSDTVRYFAYELVGDSLPNTLICLPTTASDIHALACIGMEVSIPQPREGITLTFAGIWLVYLCLPAIF